MGIAHFINTKPLSVMGILTGLHTLIYGIGYTIKTEDFIHTVLYSEVGDLMSPTIFGIIMIIVGLVVTFAFLRPNPPITNQACFLNAMVWMLVTFFYLIHGSFALGLGIGLISTLMAAYVGIAYNNQDYVLAASTQDLTDL